MRLLTLNKEIKWKIFGKKNPNYFNWQWQEKNSLTTIQDLERYGHLAKNELDEIKKIKIKFGFKVTPYFFSLINWRDKYCPIKLQIIPSILENIIKPTESEDPLAEKKYQPINGLIHKYPDRVLVCPTFLCAVHCRYCFRKTRTDTDTRHGPTRTDTRTDTDLDNIVSYLQKHTEIKEAIFSGGDPLSLSDSALKKWLKLVGNIKHIQTIRIHTRYPAVNPFRVTDNLIKILKIKKPIWVVVPFNHHKELTKYSRAAILKLVNSGIPVLNQCVLLKNINDNAKTMADLFLELIKIKVKPYYIHYLDRARGTSHFRTTISKGIEILKELRNTLPGYALPEFVIDIPDKGKIRLY